MKHNRGFIYAKYRKAAGLSQEEAAERLDKQPRTISAYENGDIAVSDDVANDMACLYNDDRLIIEHFRQSLAGQRILPAISEEGILSTAVGLLDSLNDFDKYRPTLLKIAKDNKISDDEMPEYEKICKSLESVLYGVLSVKHTK